MVRHDAVVHTLPRISRLPLPPPRGPLSDALTTFLLSAGGEPRQEDLMRLAQRAHTVDVLHDEDAQLTLLLLYELHHQGIDQVVDDLEWDLGLLWVRADLEMALQKSLQDLVRGRNAFGRRTRPQLPTDPTRVVAELTSLATVDDGTGLIGHLCRDGDLEQYREFFVHHSLHRLHEVEMPAWAIPRLNGSPRAAVVEVQSREFRGDDAHGTSPTSFARTMLALGLDDSYGAYLARVPATSLAVVNVATMFALHRSKRGAFVGHLAFSCLRSPTADAAIDDGLRRLGLHGDDTCSSGRRRDPAASTSRAAGTELATSLVEAEPELTRDVLFGARVRASLAKLVADEVLGAWSAGTSSLLPAAHHDDAPDSHQVLQMAGRRPRG